VEITPDVHLLESPKGSYCYLVMGQEPILVDTGYPGRTKRIVNDLDKLGLKPNDPIRRDSQWETLVNKLLN
jgi:glyoxylase-like metal-dependent hydrolase (beta-lactamase superfamily II)